MNWLHGILAGLLLASSAQPANHADADFRFWKPIDRAASKEEEIVAFLLDSDVYATTRGGFPDLRVLDDKQGEVPCMTEPGIEFRQERSRESFEMKIVALRPEGNNLEVHLRLPNNVASAEGFAFATPLTNYERKVRVSGSRDGVTWTPLVTDGMIFDFSRFMDVNSREITLPQNNYREFKVTIEEVTDEKESPFKELTKTFHGSAEDQRVERTTIERRPFRIDSITAWHTATRERVQQTQTAVYPITAFESKEDAAKKQTVISVRSRREPSTRFLLETPSRNFSRQVSVEVPVLRGPTTEWRQIAQSTIFNFSFRKQHREQLTIGFPEQREEQFRIVIQNEDNPPLDVTGVKAEGAVYRVVFLAQPGKAYRVFYGSPNAPAAKYEAVTVLTSLRQESQPVPAKLGVQTANAAFVGGLSATGRGMLDNWVFLGTAIGAMVAVLAWALFRAGKRLDVIPKD